MILTLSPALAEVGTTAPGSVRSGIPDRLLPDAMTTQFLATFVVPPTYSVGTPFLVDIFWATQSGLAGDVVFNVELAKVTPGTTSVDSLAFGTAVSATATAAAAGIVKKTTVTVSGTPLQSIAPGDICRILVARAGSDASDTLADGITVFSATANIGAEAAVTALEQLGLQDSIQIGSYVVVAPGTGTVTAALAGVSTNAYNNWVVLYLAAGTYVDAVDLTGKPWVMLLGEYSAVGSWGVQIYDESQSADTVLQSGSKNILANLRITHHTKNGETYKYACHADGSTISGVDFSMLYAFNCWFEASAQTAGESKAALGSRVYANQIQCFESCKFTSNGLYAIYANNGTSAQSAIGEYWFRNCTSANAGTASTAYGFLFSNGGSGKQDRIQFSNCSWVGGEAATADTKIENGGSGAWEAYLLADPACDLGTVSIGSTNRLTASLVSPRLPKAQNRTFYGGSWYSGPSGAAALSTGYLYGSRLYLGVPGGSNIPYILGNGQGYDFVDGGGNTRMTIQSNGVVTIPANGYFDLAAGVQFTIRGPLVTTIQTIAAAGTVSGTGGYYCKLTGSTATLSASGSTQTGQDMTFKNVSGGSHALSANSGQAIINLAGASVGSLTLADGAACRLIFIGSNTWHQVS